MKIRSTVIFFYFGMIPLIAFSQAEVVTVSPIEENKENKFSETKALESLLIIEGMDDSAGTGFLTEINNRVFAVTNLHVMEGYGDPKNPNVSIKTVQNEKLIIERVFGAEDHDIALIQFSDSGTFRDRALEFTGRIHTFVESGHKVQIPGNSKSGGTVLWTPGEIKGVGATKIEHTAPTYHGNSGSPVIHVDTNSVIGVDTFSVISDPIRDPLDEALRKDKDSAIENDFRQFAYRLDTPKSWYQIDLREFQKQASQLQEWERERLLAVGFIQSFSGDDSEYSWQDDSRLRGIATDLIEDVQKLSSGRREFMGTDGVYDYYSIYRVIHPKERERLRRKVIGQLHNYIGLVDKENLLKKRKIYPFLRADYEKEIGRSKLLTDFLHENREFLSE